MPMKEIKEYELQNDTLYMCLSSHIPQYLRKLDPQVQSHLERKDELQNCKMALVSDSDFKLFS